MMETENLAPQNIIRHNQVTILCSLCEVAFNPGETKTTICTNCIITQTDISIGITKEGIINFCRFCRRYLRPPWTLCERESKELLSICLKRLRGLNKVKIIDAVFVYTEASTKRIKVKLTIQKEIMNNTNLQSTFVCEFVEHYQQCEDCKKEFTPHTWGAAVQIRQKVVHKKTFFYLEQLLLKHNAHDKVLKIEQADDGLDFFYKTRSHAQRLVDYLAATLPISVKQSKQLVSHDASNNTYFYKYVYAVDLPKICKDDLVILPPKLAKELGGLGRVQVCYKISTIIHLIDPLSMKVSELSIETYQLYEHDIHLFSLRDHQSEFIILDSERIKVPNLNESYMSSSQNQFIDRLTRITLMRSEGDMVPVTVKCHIGDVLKPGNIAIGYDLANLVIEEMEDIKSYPDVIVVRKTIDKNQRSQRIFKLKRMENEMEIEGAEKTKSKKKQQQKKQEMEEESFEEFMDDVAKDKDMRKNMNLYRDEEAIKKLTPAQLKKKQQVDKQSKQVIYQNNFFNKNKQKQDEEWDDDNGDDVKLEELMRDLNLNDKELTEPVNEDEDINNFIERLAKVNIEK